PKQQAAGDVRAVGEPDGDDAAQVERVRLGGGLDERRQLLRAKLQVLLVEHAFADSPEKAQGAAFVDFSARAQERGPGKQNPTERDEIVFITTGAVQQE